ncbi:Photosystem II complex subunit Ycf12 [Moritella viscosa]|uniref:Photosystem II complex subunit Ycf12 n=1 Tax=Moritella viscosa TaxID=80854 RepID=A0A1K9YRK1_9GAMM|nr:Photosystem II complex subunit Ycf12 [Moritella viscosa]
MHFYYSIDKVIFIQLTFLFLVILNKNKNKFKFLKSNVAFYL